MKKSLIEITPFYSEASDLLRIKPEKIFTYLLLFLAIELQTVWVEPAAGTFFYGLILVIILHHYLFTPNDPARSNLILISIIPLLRMMSMAMPVGLLPPLYRYPMVGIPVFIAVYIILKLANVPIQNLGFQMPVISKQEHVWENILIALSGIPLGIIGFYFGNPIPLVSTGSLEEIVSGTLMVVIFIGILEEIVFRGLLLQAFMKTFGQVGIVIASAVFVLLFASSHSIGMVVMMGFISLLYSWHVIESKSILAVTISHSLMFVGMLIIWPLIF